MAFAALANGHFRRLAVRRKLEDAGYRHHWRRTTPTTAAGTMDTPRQYANQRPLWALFWQTGNSCCYTSYSCGNNCNVVIKLVQEYHCFLIHLTSVLWKQFAAVNDRFFREANSYKQALALRNSRLMFRFLTVSAVLSFSNRPPLFIWHCIVLTPWSSVNMTDSCYMNHFSRQRRYISIVTSSELCMISE